MKDRMKNVWIVADATAGKSMEEVLEFYMLCQQNRRYFEDINDEERLLDADECIMLLEHTIAQRLVKEYGLDKKQPHHPSL